MFLHFIKIKFYEPKSRCAWFWLDLGRRLARLPARSSAQPCLYCFPPVPSTRDRPSIQATPVFTHRDSPINNNNNNNNPICKAPECQKTSVALADRNSRAN